MSSIRLCFLSLTITLLLCGCGLNEGVLQKESKSFLWFTGNTKNSVVYIDDLVPIDLNDEKKSAHYQISPGVHCIIIKNSGFELVNRKVLLGSGITKEITIP